MSVRKDNKPEMKTQINVGAALRSKHEVYYQMASILKVISRDKGRIAQKLLDKYHPGSGNENFLENLY